jgi:hypothetical protein
LERSNLPPLGDTRKVEKNLPISVFFGRSGRLDPDPPVGTFQPFQHIREHNMTTQTTQTNTELGDRLRRLAVFADRVPQVHRVAVAVVIDRLAVILGAAVDHDDAEGAE